MLILYVLLLSAALKGRAAIDETANAAEMMTERKRPIFPVFFILAALLSDIVFRKFFFKCKRSLFIGFVSCAAGYHAEVGVTVDSTLEDTVYRTADIAAYKTVNNDLSARRVASELGLDGERCLFDNAAAEKKYLRKNEHYDNKGDNSTSAAPDRYLR